VADIAAGWASSVPELQQLGDDPLRRSGIRLHATKDYDVWLLRWPRCTRVSPHDHGSSVGAFAVISGKLMELRWDDSIPTSRVVGRGDVVTIEHGIVHDVVAISGPSYSVHAYSPPLREMSFYDEFGVEVMRQVALEGGDSKDQRVLAWW
jgi:quercetin dioxygenase-like cupin family protein